MALITFIVFWIMNLLQRFDYGGGRHLYDIEPSMYYGYFWVSSYVRLAIVASVLTVI